MTIELVHAPCEFNEGRVTLTAIPADPAETDHLAWALDVLATEATHVESTSSRVSDRIIRLLIEAADFDGMDKVYDYHKACLDRWNNGHYTGVHRWADSFEYLLDRYGSGDTATGVLDVGLRHFILTGNAAAIEAVLNECVAEFREAVDDWRAQQRYNEACNGVTCPSCGAAPDVMCMGPRGKSASYHVARAKAALVHDTLAA